MIRWYYQHEIGTIFAKTCGGGVGRVHIYGGNVFCVLTEDYTDMSTGEKMERFISFFNDKKHIERYMKDNGNKFEPIYYITSVKLNLYWKEGIALAKYFAKSGTRVTMYYKEPKQPKETKRTKK